MALNFSFKRGSGPRQINPDNYINALHYLSRPGQEEIQLDLLYNYASNIAEYPNWQKWLKETQPRLLLVWGKNDVFSLYPQPKRSKGMFLQQSCMFMIPATWHWKNIMKISQQTSYPF